jgi:hypothetical protein
MRLGDLILGLLFERRSLRGEDRDAEKHAVSSCSQRERTL